jgi:hypothetical protein
LLLPCMWVVQNLNIHNTRILLPWASNMSRKDGQICLPPCKARVYCLNANVVTI